MTSTHDASTIFHALEQDILDDLLHELTVHYARTVDHSAELDRHRFVVAGTCESDQLFSVLADLQARFEPDNVHLDANTRGAFIAFDFDDDRIENAPPESSRSYATATITPNDARSRTVSECTKCRNRCPNAYPSLVIQHRADSPYDSGEREEHDLCVHCSPGNYDDVVRGIDAFGVNDGQVEQVLYEVDVSDEDNYRTEWEQQWHDYEEGENPYVDDVVTLIERDILTDD